DDVFLGDTWIPYLAQADDILLLSRSPEGLQAKLDALARWCLRNGLAVNVSKSLIMAFGPLPTRCPRFRLNDGFLRFVQSTTYVGVIINSTKRNIFADHRAAQAKKGRRVANASLSLEAHIGPMPLDIARTLYDALIDPHLLSASAVDLDVNHAELYDLELVQHTFAKRVSRLPAHCQPLPALLDLGSWPLRFRRIKMAVKMLVALVAEGAPSVPRAALAVAHNLASHGHPSWLSDMAYTLRALPVSVTLDFRATPTRATALQALEDIQDALRTYAVQLLHTSPKLAVWKWAILPALGNNPTLLALLRTRAYRSVARVSHRRAIARLLAGIPPYAI
ncbi:uncharacterized protein TRAVEDRAFT_77127, partial [Trametes versicolor FP-101664 SS1]|uniref:uncharacterized protein n=1 Tax=Trametes versicolor (strain FP-101664) TaxID=717944 RepID=UPI0004621551